MASLIIDTQMTKAKGKIAVAGFNGEMIFIDWTTAMHRKYTFAKRLNWLNKQTGRNDHFEYFVVLM